MGYQGVATDIVYVVNRKALISVKNNGRVQLQR